MDISKLMSRLAKHGYIAILWHIDDVKNIRPDLADSQCVTVLERCAQYHDAEIGTNWQVIELHADHVFPEAREDV